MARSTMSRYQNDGIDPYQTWTQQPLLLDSFPQTIRRLCASAHKTWIVDVFFAGYQLDQAMGNTLFLQKWRDYVPRCPVSCDHIPRRSWPLFRARAVLRSVIESMKQEATP